MSDFLTRRGTTWHFVRRVPAEFSALDRRGVIRHSTRIKVAEDRVGRRAARVADTLNEELERFWKGLADGQSTANVTRYDEARRRARFVLGEGGKHMDGEAVSVRKIHSDEVEAAFHELGDKSDVTRQTVEAGDDERDTAIAANAQRLIELRPVVLATTDRFGKFADELAAFAFDVRANRSALRVETEFRFSLARRRDAVIGDILASPRRDGAGACR